MVDVISVVPAAHGWMVRAEPFDGGMMFLSGAAAESTARELGARLAAHGRPAEIRVFLRDGSLAGRFACPVAPRQLGVPAAAATKRLIAFPVDKQLRA
jgi:hypothetical protein